jgi:hypothetical protein
MKDAGSKCEPYGVGPSARCVIRVPVRRPYTLDWQRP